MFEFLNSTTSAGCNIAFLDFDDRGKFPERLTVSLTIEDSSLVQGLLEELKSRYPLEILEYDTTGKHLDDTVFYIRFAQELAQLIGDTEDQFLLQLLSDINHIVQELHNLGEDPKLVFNSVLQTGKTIKATAGKGFYADVQQVEMSDRAQLYCFQLPCGGSVFALVSADEVMLVDTGYGIYHDDVVHMLAEYGVGDLSMIKRIFVSHADADHSGGAGLFDAESFAHPGYGGYRGEVEPGLRLQAGILHPGRGVHPADKHVLEFPAAFKVQHAGGGPWEKGVRSASSPGIGSPEWSSRLGEPGRTPAWSDIPSVPGTGFPLLGGFADRFRFTLTPESEEFNILAKNLMTSVNVDSEKAGQERKGLLALSMQIDAEMIPLGKRCVVCGGHGAISVLESGKLKTLGVVERYRHKNSEPK